MLQSGLAYFLTHFQMETTYFLAKLFGVLFFFVGLGMLFNLKYYKKVMDDFLKDGPLMYFAGLVIAVVGFVMVMYHNIWSGGWPIVVTVLAWASMIKGLLFLLFPKVMVDFKKTMCGDNMVMVGGVVGLLLGLYLMYMSGMLMFLM